MGAVCSVCSSNDDKNNFNYYDKSKDNIVGNSTNLKHPDYYEIEHAKGEVFASPDEDKLLKVLNLATYYKICVIQNCFRNYIDFRRRLTNDRKNSMLKSGDTKAFAEYNQSSKNIREKENTRSLEYTISKDELKETFHNYNNNNNNSSTQVPALPNIISFSNIKNAENKPITKFTIQPENKDEIVFVKNHIVHDKDENFTGYKFKKGSYNGYGILKLSSQEIFYGKE